MRSIRSIVWCVGIIGGLAFAIHASFPNVQSWPFIWPPITGATAFWLATRHPSPRRLRTGMVATLAAAVIAGIIAFLGLAIVVNVAIHVMHPTPAQLGVPGTLVSAATLAAVAAIAGVSIVETLVGGLVTLPVRYFQTRNSR
ncbi:MAG TPA: hypothetical protein VGM82_24745 [Gemmatimonadaceae bacterium]|jgi:hypothetical protein